MTRLVNHQAKMVDHPGSYSLAPPWQFAYSLNPFISCEKLVEFVIFQLFWSSRSETFEMMGHVKQRKSVASCPLLCWSGTTLFIFLHFCASFTSIRSQLAHLSRLSAKRFLYSSIFKAEMRWKYRLVSWVRDGWMKGQFPFPSSCCQIQGRE